MAGVRSARVLFVRMDYGWDSCELTYGWGSGRRVGWAIEGGLELGKGGSEKERVVEGCGRRGGGRRGWRGRGKGRMGKDRPPWRRGRVVGLRGEKTPVGSEYRRDYGTQWSEKEGKGAGVGEW